MTVRGFTCGAFDLLHAGHVAMLREAKQQCDYLIVGLHVDPSVERHGKNSPVQTLVERYMQLSAVRFVDEVIPYQTEQELMDILHSMEIHVRIIGEEYRNTDFTGKTLCENLGIRVHYNKRGHAFSSTSLKERVKKMATL